MKSLSRKRGGKVFPILTNIMMRSKHHAILGSGILSSAHLVKHMNKSNIKKNYYCGLTSGQLCKFWRDIGWSEVDINKRIKYPFPSYSNDE